MVILLGKLLFYEKLKKKKKNHIFLKEYKNLTSSAN